MKNKIIIVTGDPNSINSELIFKCWRKINSSLKKKIYLIGSYDLILKQFKKLNYPIKISKVKNLDANVKGKNLKIIDINLKFKNPFKVSRKVSSKYVLNSLHLAHKLAISSNNGIINCAISKLLLGNKNIGVTEFLAKKCNIRNKSEVMLINNKKLSVSPITTHISLKDVSSKINRKIISNKIKTIQVWFKKKFNKKPKLAILGLNPHNAELKNKSEERKIIIPTVNHLRKLGINIKGPLVADTVFVNDYKNFDVIIGMYHDQVLGPFKTMFKFDAINITLGLKYLRVSPDHGTASNIIGKNKGNYISLLRCIHFLNKNKK
jgi:4-hydroxy-L-threonine phosphate dehydrogenase PdxA